MSDRQLSDIIKGIGEEQTKKLLSSFYCPLNKDVEKFLKERAIEFSKRDLSKTHLVYWSCPDGHDRELVGYYTISHKSILVSKDNVSKRLYRGLSEFGDYLNLVNMILSPNAADFQQYLLAN